ncbi:MAG: radical SAM protein [Elusimicrobiales bacterium]|nr:radical SAM protein [Elusimicrobiales bacterium]
MFKEVMLELTWRCNLRCSFCYLLGRGLLNKGGPELGTAGALKLIDRFPAGTRFYLSGGEPLLRADIFTLMARIKERGGRFGLNTNGTLLDAARGRRLAALGPDYVIFSLHGPAKVHDKLTGSRGACRALLGNMELFSAAAGPGTEVLVNCVVNRENAGVLAEVYRLACAHGAGRVVFEHLQFLRPEEAAALPAALRRGGVITPELAGYKADAALIARQLEEIRRLGGPARFDVRPLMSAAALDLYYNRAVSPEGACCRVYDTLNVEPDGRARLCVLYGLKAGDALRTPLAAMAALKKKTIGRRLPAGCARCCHRLEAFRYF